METCSRNRMTQKAILFATLVILMYIEKSQGFFLNNLLSETITEQPKITTTAFSSDKITYTTDTNQVQFDEIENNSEKVQVSSTEIVKSVKNIVSLVLDEHIAENKTKLNLTEENNLIDVELRNINPDSKNDIPSSEAFLTNIDQDLNDPALNIVKISETKASSEDIAAALEDNIRSSVKDEIQLEQNFESSAIIDDIPDAEVRQTLTEDLMAIEYPQSVKKLLEESDKIDTTEVPIGITTDTVISETNRTPTKSVAEATTIAVYKAEIVSDIEVTTPAINILEEITPIPSSIRSRQMRAFSEESDTNEVLPESQDSSEDKNSSDSSSSSSLSSNTSLNASTNNKSSTKDENIAAEETSEEVNEVVPKDESIEESLEKESVTTTQTESVDRLSIIEKSISTKDSSDSSSSSSLSSNTSLNPSSNNKSSTKDENIAAEETSEEVNEAVSKDASIEDSLEKENVTTYQAITTQTESDDRLTTTNKSILTKKVTPTPRPSIVTTTEVYLKGTTDDLIHSQNISSIEVIEGTTESSGEILNSELAVMVGDGKHIVFKKPGVEEELSSSHITRDPNVLSVNTIETKDETATEIDSKVTTEKDFLVSHILSANTNNLGDVFEATSPSTKIIVDERLVTEIQLLERKSNESIQENKTIDRVPLVAPLENTEQVLVPEIVEAITENTESKSTQNSNITLLDNNAARKDQSSSTIDQDKIKNVDEQKSRQTDAPKVHQSNPSDEIAQESYSEQQEALNTGEIKSIQVPSTELNTDLQVTLDTDESKYLPENATKQLETEVHKSSQTPSYKSILPILKTSTEAPFANDNGELSFSLEKKNLTNEISKFVEVEESQQTQPQESITYESSTEKPIARSNGDSTSPPLIKTIIEAAELTTEFARHIDSFHTTRDEASAISDEIVSPAAAGRSFNTIIAEGLGKPLPTRSVGDEPSSSSYSSEDKTTTIVVLCSAAAIMFIAFSVAIYLITFQRQHGTLDIEMQEQRCGKGDLEEDEDAETRVSLLNQLPPVDSDENSFD